MTDRHGGVSTAPYDELNLGGHVGDDPAAVAENRDRVAAAIGLPNPQVLYMNQVHGRDVSVVAEPWDGPAPDVDALVTAQPGLALAVLVADCVPVLLADPAAGVLGVAHAGRPGLVAGVVPAVVAVMRDVGARDISARIGPAVCGECYEVPAQMQADALDAEPAAMAITRHGTPAVDVPNGVAAQLAGIGVSATRWHVCTLESAEYFSHRGQRPTGRFAGLAWMTPR
jgi:YfiH family protein